MKYVALLRGINVGGKNKVEMAKLAESFINLGFNNLKTYINSGNVIFETSGKKRDLAAIIEKQILIDFRFFIKVIVRDQHNISEIAAALPSGWANNQLMKGDVIFLPDKYNSKNTVKELSLNPEVDEVAYVAGAILWRADKAKLTKSGLLKLPKTELYKHVTIRNVNTLRKLNSLMNSG